MSSQTLYLKGAASVNQDAYIIQAPGIVFTYNLDLIDPTSIQGKRRVKRIEMEFVGKDLRQPQAVLAVIFKRVPNNTFFGVQDINPTDLTINLNGYSCIAQQQIVGQCLVTENTNKLIINTDVEIQSGETLTVTFYPNQQVLYKEDGHLVMDQFSFNVYWQGKLLISY